MANNGNPRLLVLLAAVGLPLAFGVGLWTGKSVPAPEAPPSATNVAPAPAATNSAVAATAPVKPTDVKGAAPTQTQRTATGPAVTIPADYETLRTALAETRKEAGKLRADLEASGERLRQEEAKVATLNQAEERWKAKTNDLEKTIAVLENDIRAKSDRLVKLESSERLAREAATRAESNLGRATQSNQELEDLNRRREALFTSISRRYRDVTDQYRTLSLRLQSRDGQQGLGFDSIAGELSRIQASMQQTEEDLRQLSALNAQSNRLLREAARK